MFCVTGEAGVILDTMKQEGGNKKLTILSSGVGCGSPVLKIEMREPLEDDVTQTVDGHEFRIRSAVVRYLEETELTVEDTFWGKKLKLHTVNGCRE